MDTDKEFRQAAMKVVKQFEELLDIKNELIAELRGKIKELEGSR